jgi:hypothetical protein
METANMPHYWQMDLEMWYLYTMEFFIFLFSLKEEWNFDIHM